MMIDFFNPNGNPPPSLALPGWGRYSDPEALSASRLQVEELRQAETIVVAAGPKGKQKPRRWRWVERVSLQRRSSGFKLTCGRYRLQNCTTVYGESDSSASRSALRPVGGNPRAWVGKVGFHALFENRDWVDYDFWTPKDMVR